MRAIAGCALFVLALVGAPAHATATSAQSTTATAADVQRLQDQVYDLDRELSRHRGADPQRVSQLQTELDDLRDEVVYLRVKLRREGTCPETTTRTCAPGWTICGAACVTWVGMRPTQSNRRPLVRGAPRPTLRAQTRRDPPRRTAMWISVARWVRA